MSLFLKNLYSLKNDHLNLVNKIDSLIDLNNQCEETSFINSLFDVDPFSILFFFGYEEYNLINVISFIENIRHVVLDDGELYLHRKPDDNANSMALRVLTALNKVDKFRKSYHYSVSESRGTENVVFLSRDKLLFIFHSINEFKSKSKNLDLTIKEDKEIYKYLSDNHIEEINSLF